MEHARNHDGGNGKVSRMVSTSGLVTCVYLDGSQRATPDATQRSSLPGLKTLPYHILIV